ncbi:hypothetical protein GGE07_001524 [Sinorhizobium terangae]|uniref:Uncharacterized protein n=1 Tax=Sinorhizobium terangae TaxID=110322 RepID=A0A6N7LMH1_SINTE|nr:hypothetical protein [Sinorhizobium terangae]MBB4184895.1 hypothetical protein [Sinorhizobium terangae]MQX18419.1 hypothetical protein [Sinorhizobium terangae]
MREMDRLTKLLFPEGTEGSKIIDLKFFPGEQAVTVEEFCKDVHAAFVQADSGQSEKSEWFHESTTRAHVDRFLMTA